MPATVSLIIVGALFAAGSGCGHDDRSPIPDDYYAQAGEPPDQAQLVEVDELERLIASREASPISIRTLREREAWLAEQEAEDERVIAEAGAAYPGLTLMPSAPPEDDPAVRPYGRDYLRTIALNDGRTTEVVTLGLRWQKHVVAEALRTYSTRENQLATYQLLYARLDASWRSTLSLVDPGVIVANPERYSTEMIAALVDRIGARSGEIADRAPPPPQPPPPPSPLGGPPSCTMEAGYGGGSDSSGSSYVGTACALRSGGIFAAHTWALKPYLTCVGDQRARGTCTAFATASAVEAAVAQTHGIWTNLSEQAFYNRALMAWVPFAPRDYGDGMPPYHGLALMAATHWLFPFEDQWTYNPSPARIDFVDVCQAACTGPGQGACEFGCTLDPINYRYDLSCAGYFGICSDTAHQSEMFCAQLWLVGFRCAIRVPDINPMSNGYRIAGALEIYSPANTVNSLNLLRAFLSWGVNAVISHPVTPSFGNAGTDGYVLYTGSGEPNGDGHAVHAVGFVSNAVLAAILPSAPPGPGGGYLIIKNSWSNCWGDAGYAYIPYQSILDRTHSMSILTGVL